MSDEKKTPPDLIYSKIVGVTFGNKVPSGEVEPQWALAQMARLGILNLELVQEPNNEYDKDAIAIHAKIMGEDFHIGHVRNSDRRCPQCNKEYHKSTGALRCEQCDVELWRNGLATELTKWMADGYEFSAFVTDFTGGNGKTRGCNIEIRRTA